MTYKHTADDGVLSPQCMRDKMAASLQRHFHM